MIRPCGKIIVSMIIAGAAFGMSFLVTRNVVDASNQEHPLHRSMRNWLGISPEQAIIMHQLDNSFDEEVSVLVSSLYQEQAALANLIEEGDSTDEKIMGQVDKVIAAHDGLIRRVGGHILAIRKQLSPEKQKKLMGFCARIIRTRGGQKRQCWQECDGCPLGQGQKAGQGAVDCPAARGNKCGKCQRCPFAQGVGLTTGQDFLVHQKDPEFDEESSQLGAEVRKEHEQLACLFEITSTTDDEIQEQLEKLIAAHDRLERRMARHVLLVRGCLTPEQQKKLVGLCALYGGKNSKAQESNN